MKGKKQGGKQGPTKAVEGKEAKRKARTNESS
jgi:hypothetical protein